MCKDYSEEAYKEDKWPFLDSVYMHCCEMLSNFTGETFEIENNGNDITGSANNTFYDNDVIFYVPCYNYPILFSIAYSNIEEMVDEMKNRVGKYLPEGFDYRGKLRHIVGAYYG